jgi:hypothetical protein
LKLNEIVNQIFPPVLERGVDVVGDGVGLDEYNDLSYWKSVLPDVDIVIDGGGEGEAEDDDEDEEESEGSEEYSDDSEDVGDEDEGERELKPVVSVDVDGTVKSDSELPIVLTSTDI